MQVGHMCMNVRDIYLLSAYVNFELSPMLSPQTYLVMMDSLLVDLKNRLMA